MAAPNLRQDFKSKLDNYKTATCIWCKSGNSKGKKKHQLLDCPNAELTHDQRTDFSHAVHLAGQTEEVRAYIGQLQGAYWRRRDGVTPFGSGRQRNNLLALPDVGGSPAVGSGMKEDGVAASGPVTSGLAPSGPVASAPAASTALPIIVKSAPTKAAATVAPPADATNTATVPQAPTTTAPPSALPSTNASTSASTGTPIPIAYDDENVPVLPAQKPGSHEMQRGGQVVNPKVDTNEKLKALNGVALDFPARSEFIPTTDRIFTNHFQISINPALKLYRYTISSNLSGKNKRKIRALIKTAIASYNFLRDNQASLATDYFATIIARKPLHSAIDAQHLRDNGDGITPGSTWQLRPYMRDDQNEVRVTLAYEGMVDIESLLKHTDIDPTCATVDLEPTKRALNIIISKCFGETTDNMIQVGANKFFHKRGISTLQGRGAGGRPQNSVALCTMRGYYYTVKAGVRNVLLNINPCTSAFFTKVRVSALMNDLLTFNPWEREGVLRGVRVRIMLDRGDKQADPAGFARLNTPHARVKTIQGLGKPLKDEEFKDADGNVVKVLTHLQNSYPHRQIQYPNLPAVNLGSSYEPRWYAPEDLLIMPYQIYTSIVPAALTESMLEVACLTPDEASARVDVEALKALGIPPSQNNALPLAKCTVLTLNPQMLLVPRRRFDCPSIQYSNEIVHGQSSWNLIKKRFFRSQRKAFRVLALFEHGVDENNMGVGLETFQRFANVNYGVMNAPPIQRARLNDPKDASEIAEVFQKYEAIQGRTPDFVLLILKSRNVEAYSRFKDFVDRTAGCHSICMTERIFGRGIASCMGNIMMKANLKSAGSNHTIRGGILQNIMTDTLVLGADVTHPSGGSIPGCPSIAAIVGSVDDHAGRFLGSMRLQSASKKEMIDSVETMVVERIKDWVKNNSLRLPKNIIYYRDGVSEGQYKEVRDEELPQILSAFAKALQELRQEHQGKSFTDATPNLTAIVCAKRHHVRFYPKVREMKNGNCHPGTYVDDVVTSPFYADFYLQSHAPLQGTARPAHYFVLRNDTDRTIEQLRQLTHELCFTYVRTTGAVSYASPAYYADRLCERGRCYLRDFFVNTPEGRTRRYDLSTFRRSQEAQKAQLRRGRFGASGHGDRTRRVKAFEEREVEDRHRRDVDEVCSRYTMDEARRVFYVNGMEGNPWKESIAGTMFWM